jgi:hypothetical protein
VRLLISVRNGSAGTMINAFQLCSDAQTVEVFRSYGFEKMGIQLHWASKSEGMLIAK